MFQSTLPRGERLCNYGVPAPPSGFNPRSRVGSDQILLLDTLQNISFNPRSRVGSDFAGLQSSIMLTLVSIHAPAWGATYAIYTTITACKFQSTLPRGERRYILGSDGYIHRVSIHAPAWGATSSFFPPSPCMQVSIHAPAWGATPIVEALDNERYVSIHAPAWGATSSWHLVVGLIYQFQSTLPRGERLTNTKTVDYTRSFNPRSRVGSDLA